MAQASRNKSSRMLAVWQSDMRWIHLSIVSVIVAVPVVAHLSAYALGTGSLFSDFVHSKWRALSDLDMLVALVYAGMVFRVKGSCLTLIVASTTLAPLLLMDTSEGAVRDNAIVIGLILLFGAFIATLQKIVARERESREKLMETLDRTNQQLGALNRMAQMSLNTLFDDVTQAIESERQIVEAGNPRLAAHRYPIFLEKLLEVIAGTRLANTSGLEGLPG